MSGMYLSVLQYLKRHRGDLLAVALVSILIGILLSLDLGASVRNLDGNEGRLRVKAKVLAVDNTMLVRHGVLYAGNQNLGIEILSGKFKGRRCTALNLLRSQMELDKIFVPGDIILASVLPASASGEKMEALAQDHYRVHHELWLLLLFTVFLLLFGGFTGLKALLTFLFTCALVWKVLIPLFLTGHDPVWLSLAAVCVLCAVIIYSVAGVGRKGQTAFLGAFLGVLASCLMAKLFTELLHVNAATMPRSQALFFAGYEFLDLTGLFIGALFLASSGAVMDLAMDVAAGMNELVLHKPGISRKELLKSGLAIGRAVVGTMTTTLLLAYTGGYLTLMMSFTAEGVQMLDFFNYPYVVPEIVKTMVGSMGLVLVAPLTAVAGCWILPRNPIFSSSGEKMTAEKGNNPSPSSAEDL